MDVPELTLKQDVPTRWNSTYEMLDRVLKTKNPIIATLALMKNDISLLNEDWLIIEEVVPILKVFYDVTIEICTEKNVSLSKVIVYCRLLKNHISQCLSKVETQTLIQKQHFFEDVRNLLETLRCEIHTRFYNIEKNFLYAESPILDPRFKIKGFRDELNYRKTLDSLKL